MLVLEWKIGDVRFYGEAFYGEAYKCYLQFYSKCDTLLSSIPICEAVDTFQKGMEQK